MLKTASQIAVEALRKSAAEEFRPSVSASIGAPLGIGLGTVLGADVINTVLVNQLVKREKAPLKGAVRDSLKKLRQHNPTMQLPAKIFRHPSFAGYDLKNQALILPRKAAYETLAHELGHGQTRWLHPLKRLAVGLRPKAPAVALGMSTIGALANQEEAVKAAPLVGLGMVAPALLEEINASVRGHRILRKSGIKPKLFSMYGPNMTYLAASLLPAVLAPWLVGKALLPGDKD
jgi:hypothetical protein